MMLKKWIESRFLWGLMLIIAGGLFLLQNLGLFEASGLVWAALLGLGGVFFVSVFIQSREHWWALIPGITLLAVALLIFLGNFFPRASNILGGAIVLGGIGLAFLMVYLANRENWWALIPMGVMLTLAGVSTLDEIAGFDTGGIFFIGLGLTFALVALLPSERAQMRWAWIPAGILLVMGLLISASAASLMGYVGPAVLILAGLFFILRAAAR
jgi:hypothetical protein